jgi:hypothetical protein
MQEILGYAASRSAAMQALFQEGRNVRENWVSLGSGNDFHQLSRETPRLVT